MLILLRRQSQKAWRLVASKASFHLPGCVSEPPGEEGACEVRSVYLLRKSLVRHSAIGHLRRWDFDARQTCIRGPNISGHPNRAATGRP
ncbi:hypothetical protein PAPYR_11736 [Paratrimastix pyriformis]|uniref:Uncharacterized protein n=1 Tax=Paratrimastix pyriformis TaxID=342808 RepID=A0ABQ8U5M2_9EUKA|nr:hypothetical protein PAPYR_11736 [Paratrimastix pyriformis]